MVACMGTSALQYNQIYVVYMFSSIAGSDYEGLTGVLLTFGPNVTRATTHINVNNDNIFEVTEQFYASLALTGGPINRVAVNSDHATVIILDDDGKILCTNKVLFAC